ncbi:hypothetical protein DL98DRAFT_658105 [Cadophora sp. DSE1049]|nr:hypothetical protein DL98DRAFT_658105 [Cadophora sp. DSE1049]
MAVNLTDVSLNVENIINTLNPVANCTIAGEWYSTTRATPSSYESTTLNLDWLNSSLPLQYQAENIHNDPQFPQLLQTVHIELERKFSNQSDGDNAEWYSHALWAIGSECIGKDVVATISLSDLRSSTDGPDCSIPAAFISDLKGPDAFEDGEMDLHYYMPSNSEPELAFWRALLNFHRPNISDEAVITWYTNLFLTGDASEPTLFLREWYRECKTNICKASGFTGNPDIGGIGVMIAYLLEACLVTFLWVHHLIFRYRPFQKAIRRFSTTFGTPIRQDKVTYRQRYANVVDDASASFLDGAMYFLLALCLAALIDIQSSSLYSHYLANTIIIAMFFSLVTLALITKRAVVLKKRAPICLCLGVSAAVFAVTQALISSGKFSDDADSACLKAQLKIEKGITQGAFDIVPLFMLAAIIFFSIAMLGSVWYTPNSNNARTSTKSPTYAKAFKFAAKMWWMSYPFIGMVVLFGVWLHIYLLINLRRLMRELAGDTWSEAEWGFGQVTAVLMWLPVLFTPLWEVGDISIDWVKEKFGKKRPSTYHAADQQVMQEEVMIQENKKSDTITKSELVEFQTENDKLTMKLIPPGFNNIFILGSSNHEIIKVTLRSGDAFAFDIAGAQYGYVEPITAWKTYQEQRVLEIVKTSTAPKSKVLIQVDDYSLAKMLHLYMQVISTNPHRTVSSDTMGAMNFHFLELQAHERLSLKAMWKLPDKKFQTKMTDMVNFMDWKFNSVPGKVYFTVNGRKQAQTLRGGKWVHGK